MKLILDNCEGHVNVDPDSRKVSYHHRKFKPAKEDSPCGTVASSCEVEPYGDKVCRCEGNDEGLIDVIRHAKVVEPAHQGLCSVSQTQA